MPSKDTVHKYEFRVTRFLLFPLCVSTNDVYQFLHPFITPDIRKAIVELHTFLPKDTNQALVIMHNIFSKAHQAPLSNNHDTIPIFISCLSVFQNSHNQCYRFAAAKHISRALAALKYLLRAFVITDIHIY